MVGHPHRDIQGAALDQGLLQIGGMLNGQVAVGSDRVGGQTGGAAEVVFLAGIQAPLTGGDVQGAVGEEYGGEAADISCGPR